MERYFIARNACGCYVNACISTDVEAASLVKGWIKKGLIVKQVNAEFVNQHLGKGS